MKRTVIFAALLLAGCSAQSIETVETDNADVTAELLATVDGCRLFRVNDGGLRTVYFANCGKTTTAEYERGCGENCTERVTALTWSGTGVTSTKSTPRRSKEP